MSALKERKTRELEIEQTYLATLSGSNRRLDEQKREKKHKKKTAQELFERLDVAYISGYIIRPADQYIPKSYNIDRQTVGLIDHLFVKYRVPDFFYKICLNGRFTDAHIRQTYQRWFIVLAQGGSFRKLVQDVMTSKEAATFLAGPYDDIHDNVWWAKMTIAGVPRSILYRLIDRIFHDYDVKHFASRRMTELIQFYAQYGDQMDKNTFQEITDFAAWKLRNDPWFQFKGRTLNSMCMLSNEWHLMMQKASLGRYCSWPYLGAPEWEHETDREVWSVIELRSNVELMKEGRKQKHCVYSYVSQCSKGNSHIFSLRGYRKLTGSRDENGNTIAWIKESGNEFTRITMELNRHRHIVQVRGYCNRSPSEQERNIIHHWASHKGLCYTP